MEYLRQIIQSRGWQELCKHPKVVAMTVVHEFYANTWDSTPTPMVFVQEKQVRYDAGVFNTLLQLQYNPHGPDVVALLVDSTNMEEISAEICGRVTKSDIVRGVHAHFPLRDLQQNMKVWHHFICGRLVPTLHTLEVTKEKTLLLFGIKKGLKINVGWWI